MKPRLDAPTVKDIARLFDEMLQMFGRASDGNMLRLLAKFDLNLPQLIALDMMNLGPQSVSSLAAALQLTPGAVSRMVDHLVKKRLVSREEGTGDRRRKFLTLTTAGKHAVMQLARARDGNVIKSVSGFDPDLGKDFQAILTRIVAHLRSRATTKPDAALADQTATAENR